MRGSTVLAATGAVIKAHRALRCISTPTTPKMHIIGYNERGMYLSLFRNFPIAGNPNLKEGLKLLKFIIHCQCDCESNQTRSIFLLNTLGEVLSGWLKPVQSLYMFPEFAKGLRYVIALYQQLTKNLTPFLSLLTYEKEFFRIFQIIGSILLLKQLPQKDDEL